ncbi:thioredoxin-like protein [Gregarina niphandrodes]|uniref:Thioredoxin-like protein n=1 Tax=Gregarina niphandrodes TaxID=110365 RepID=A0A023BCY6_GRENI|nr:thioredoxin-like protein [Gregarina niphandrodes]EZG86539.1 thioredoxin-like protein [Gregarina niphandrodes]|eukprot:XP_011128749.1 thioredoxin-like protein [Gregarina niphandrodes]
MKNQPGDYSTIVSDPMPDYRPYCNRPGVCGPCGGQNGPEQAEPELPVSGLLGKHNGSIKTARGAPVRWDENTSIALYFGAGNLRKSRNLTPWLSNFYETINKSGKRQKLEIIYIPLDFTADEYAAHRSRMPWPALDFANKEAIEEFQREYAVFTPLDNPNYGAGPRYRAPHLTIISKDGLAIRDIPLVDENTIKNNLSKWDFYNARFW